MKRRNFIQSGLVAAPFVMGGVGKLNIKTENAKHNFKMKYAPHLGMFKNHAGDDPVDQINFMAEMGFRAFEDNGMANRSIDDQKRIGEALAKNGMDMGVFVAHKIYWKEPNLANGNKEKRDEFLQSIKDSVEVAKRVNAKWMTVVPGHLDLRKEMGYQTQNVVDSLKMACEILEPHNLTMVLEPLNFRDHPGLFLTKAAQGFEICSSVGSPSCKILFDIYHQQITEGNLIPNIEAAWDEIAYFQIGDNPGRKEPTTGEINYKNVFKFIHDKGFDGILGMEHGNFNKGKEGEEQLIKAYVTSDDF
ncbi:hydroxypyruvate isomerase family protein [Portibacter lacus]|uniref:Hydroxypyruvate isomerase n=1 Tax=Portibacter lacus TaxID=1099794 RepID=A0AA37SMP6_9BACT|nr:TIM barrel protein [Portibacter lacus]GLR15666.1 hydroxypyruvate isomerase [Portibacter lacus]